MKYLLLLASLCILLIQSANAQYYEEDVSKPPIDFDFENNAITVGILQGGGALIGIDYERLLSDRVGIQAGLGWLSFGGGLNVHIAPEIKSSFFHLGYWHQGVGEYFAQDLAVATYAYRSKRWFTAQVGLGKALSKGPAWDRRIEQAPIQFVFSLGAYFSFR